METLPCSAGELLRSYRARSGLTQHDLATQTGVSVRALRDLERDRTRRPRARAVHVLAEALALTPAEHEDLQRALAGAGRTGAGNHLYVAALGPLTVRRGARPVDVGPVKQRLLLGLLAIQPDQPVSTDEIVENLWPSRPPRTYQGLVHSYVARLRRSIEAQQHGGPARLITSRRGSYRLDPSHTELDVVRFEELVTRARRAGEGGDGPGALAGFASALGYWRGPVLADLGPVLPQHPAAVALARHRLDAALGYADLAIHSGQQEHALAVLHDLAEAEALHEGLYARLMLALAGTGQQMAALRLFDQIRTRLAGELGIAPGPELTAAHLRVLRQDLPAPRGVAAPRVTAEPGHRAGPPVAPAQLPPDVADFTGRERELRRLHSLMRAGGPEATALPIVLLSGPPGVGKPVPGTRPTRYFRTPAWRYVTYVRQEAQCPTQSTERRSRPRSSIRPGAILPGTLQHVRERRVRHTENPGRGHGAKRQRDAGDHGRPFEGALPLADRHIRRLRRGGSSP